MTTYSALLRAVSVGGTGKLPMADLKALSAELGYRRIETFIANGNVVFDCDLAAERVQAQLEKRLLIYAGKAAGHSCEPLQRKFGFGKGGKAPPFHDGPSRTFKQPQVSNMSYTVMRRCIFDLMRLAFCARSRVLKVNTLSACTDNCNLDVSALYSR
jgi:hypothetical protein